jgi:DNA mismatch endonuclease (patch repair protein)
VPGLRTRADVVFPRAQVAVFVDGCFWHGCPQHASWPKTNAEWWRQKIEANRLRDREKDERLSEAGWTVIRVWEHEDVKVAADLIQVVVVDARAARGRTDTQALEDGGRLADRTTSVHAKSPWLLRAAV